MMKVLILGMGSSFGDDRLGWMAVEALQGSPALAEAKCGSLAFAVLDHPGALLLTGWQDADNMLLIDAVRSGAAPGALRCLDSAGIAADGPPASSHGFGVAAALDLGRALGVLPGRVWLYGIEMDSAHDGPNLSPAVRSALPALVDRIQKHALRLLAEPESSATLPHRDEGGNRAT